MIKVPTLNVFSPPLSLRKRRTYNCETFLGRGLGRGPASVLRVPFSRWLGRDVSGLGGKAGGSAVAGMDKLCGSGTGRRRVRSYTLYGGGVLLSLRTGSSGPPP